MKQLLFAALLSTCTLSAIAAAPHHAPWTYESPAWGDLDAEYATCKLGKEQSPIDIRGALPGGFKPIHFAYAAGSAKVLNNGHTIAVRPESGSKAHLPSGDYELIQFHFHTPSEEVIDGKTYPMVAHMVHMNSTGQFAVVAVLFEEGGANPIIEQVFSSMPAHGAEPVKLAGTLNPEALLPKDRTYFAYTGSLTTPPCSEGVLWHVIKQPVGISAAQIAAFKALYPMNARPVQPLNGRTIGLSQ